MPDGQEVDSWIRTGSIQTTTNRVVKRKKDEQASVTRKVGADGPRPRELSAAELRGSPARQERVKRATPVRQEAECQKRWRLMSPAKVRKSFVDYVRETEC